MPNLAEADASEEDKVRAMMSQAGEDYNPTTLVYLISLKLTYSSLVMLSSRHGLELFLQLFLLV